MNNLLFKELVASIRLAGKINRGSLKPQRKFIYSQNNIRAIRHNIGLTQSQFAMMIGVSLRTLQNWEQGHRKPVGPALALLTIIKNNPKHAFTSLFSAS